MVASVRARDAAAHPDWAGRLGQDAPRARGCGELVPAYKAGVFWVGLAALREPSLVTETIAQTLGARDGLAEHIGDREMLLLLDNLEQVIEAAPALSGLVQSCPNLALFVTSRELLRVQGEVEYAVPPLASSEAVALFCERSRLEASDEIAELCSASTTSHSRSSSPPPARRHSRRADPGAPLPATRPAERRQRCRGATADTPGDDRVELRPPLRGRATSLPSALGLRGWLHAGRGRGGRRGRPRHAAVARREEPPPLHERALLDAGDDPRVRLRAPRRLGWGRATRTASPRVEIELGGSRRPAVIVVAVVVGLLVVFNGAFFVAAYFPGSCRACHSTRTSTSGRLPPTRT